MKDEVIDFIVRRFGDTDARWQDGNCYWFAQILIKRFPYLSLYYEPVIGHFYVKDNVFNRCYDSSGLVELHGIEWKFLLIEEPQWCKRILRDCRD